MPGRRISAAAPSGEGFADACYGIVVGDGRSQVAAAQMGEKFRDADESVGVICVDVHVEGAAVCPLYRTGSGVRHGSGHD